MWQVSRRAINLDSKTRGREGRGREGEMEGRLIQRQEVDRQMGTAATPHLTLEPPEVMSTIYTAH